jgi:hypothetical protein
MNPQQQREASQTARGCGVGSGTEGRMPERRLEAAPISAARTDADARVREGGLPEFPAAGFNRRV